MSTEPNPVTTQPEPIDIEAIVSQVVEKVQGRLETLAGELHLKANAFVPREEFDQLTAKLDSFKGEVVKMAEQLAEVSKRLNMAFDEIRSIGGERVPPKPAKLPEKVSRPLTLLEFGE